MPSPASGLHDALENADQQQDGPDGDPGSGSSSSDFAEQDDDDDCSEEPTALVIHARAEPAPWESARSQRTFACDPLISDHRTLELRPPRAI